MNASCYSESQASGFFWNSKNFHGTDMLDGQLEHLHVMTEVESDCLPILMWEMNTEDWRNPVCHMKLAWKSDFNISLNVKFGLNALA